LKALKKKQKVVPKLKRKSYYPLIEQKIYKYWKD